MKIMKNLTILKKKEIKMKIYKKKMKHRRIILWHLQI